MSDSRQKDFLNQTLGHTDLNFKFQSTGLREKNCEGERDNRPCGRIRSNKKSFFEEKRDVEKKSIKNFRAINFLFI